MKSWKNVYKIRLQRFFFFKLVANDRSDKSFCWRQNFVPWELSAPDLWLYTFIKSWKDVYKVRGWRDFFWNLQQMTKVMRPSCWHQNFGPNGLSASAQGLCTCIKSWKNVHKIRGQNYFLKHATSDQSDDLFCFHQKNCPRGLSPFALGLYIHVWNKTKYHIK